MGKNLINMAETAAKGLEKSMLGGVKKESAVKALKEVAEEGSRQVSELSQTVSSQSARITTLSDEVRTAQQQLNNANASLNYAQTELATKNKALTETTEQLTKTKSDLAEAKNIKKGETVLEDGSVQEIKVNKNGTRMKKIKAANGNLKSVEVEQLDGSKRYTEYDTLSGKPVSTKTNTTGEEVNIEYDLSGKTAKVSSKAEPKPELLKRTKEGSKIVEEFSDGSKVIRSQVAPGKSQLEKFDKSGKLVEKYQENVKGDATDSLHVLYKDNQEVITRTWKGPTFENTRVKTISTNEFGEKFVSESKFTCNEGEVVYRPTKTDMMGNITNGESVATYNLPENADGFRVKTVKTEYDIVNNFIPFSQIKKDTVIAKNGSRLERLYDNSGRLSQSLAYDEKGTGNSYIKDKFRFSARGYGNEPLEYLPDMTTHVQGLF